jgi:hypothetical protein
MFAVAYQQQDFARPCPGSTQRICDASCYNVFTLIVGWMVLTPEFQLSVVLISQPLALLVALWGMTSERLRSRMQSTQHGPASWPLN